MTAELLRIESRQGKRTGQCIIRVSGALDLNTELRFLEQIRIETAPIVILDLTGVPSSDSRGVAALVQIHNSFKRENRRLALVGLSYRVRHVLEITRVLGLFTVFLTLAEAEEAVV
jgi:anti-anti-sigma factor